MVQQVFANNCVAIVFVVAIILNLVLPKDMEVKAPAAEKSKENPEAVAE